VEEAPAQAMVGACLEVDEVRYNFNQICSLYESETYPLQRRSDADSKSGSPPGGSKNS
jgi:hypothetical protein